MEVARRSTQMALFRIRYKAGRITMAMFCRVVLVRREKLSVIVMGSVFAKRTQMAVVMLSPSFFSKHPPLAHDTHLQARLQCAG